MKIKRMSLRFSLENETDRKAWEHLQNLPDSKNKAIITAINTYFEQGGNLAEVIKQTIKDCFWDVSFVQAQAEPTPEILSEEETEFMDSMEMFLGN